MALDAKALEAARAAMETAHSSDAMEQCGTCKGQGVVVVDYGEGPGGDMCPQCGGAGVTTPRNWDPLASAIDTYLAALGDGWQDIETAPKADISDERLGEFEALADELTATDVCPFCGNDPYHYVDVGLGGRGVPAAVVCCDHGIGLYQHSDEGLSRASGKLYEAGYAIRSLITELQRRRNPVRGGALIPPLAEIEQLDRTPPEQTP